jgi:hypothetical protein
LYRHEQRIEQQLGSYHEALHMRRELSARDIDAYPIAIKDVLAQPVIGVRQQTSVLQIETTRARAFGELYGFLKQNNISPTELGFSTNASEGKFEPHEELNVETDWFIDVCTYSQNYQQSPYRVSSVSRRKSRLRHPHGSL